MNQFEDDASKQSSFHDIINKYPYSPASTASSSSASLFSADGKSSQSSAPSSVKSGSPTWDLDSNNTAQSVASAGYLEFQTSSNNLLQASRPTQISQQTAIHIQQIVSSKGAVAPELRTHPRRTQPSVQLNQKDVRAPPSLVRQCDRKDNFVESLVGKPKSPDSPQALGLTYHPSEETTTQMIEVIWPLSVIPCERDSVLGGKNLIGLRTFIQEVLKRSKTSYSTLQVALYYLVLIKPCIPKVDFTKEQTEDSHTTRAMQCGRRMFLAALILASKYLQDRNYSARAWSKISGLKVEEINSNERAFVAAVNWSLHVPEQRFQRWTDVVLKYSLSQPSQPSLRFNESSPNCWRSIIPRLTPELKDLEVPEIAKPSNVSVPMFSKCPVFSSPMCPPPSFRRTEESPLGSGESTPTPSTRKPTALEPTPRASKENFRFPPISPRITQLPTPVMTPRTTGFITPAASVGSYCRGQSMSDAMRQVQRSTMERYTMDTWPCPPPLCEAFPNKRFPAPSRRPSYALSSSSTISSPESMISDFPSTQGSSCSSRTSRSSSVCSVASSAGALPQPTRLAVQATRRCATMAVVKEQAFGGFSTESNLSLSAINEPYIRCFEDSETSEAAAALALSDMACSKPYVSSSISAGLQRKRERSSSTVDNDFDNAVRLALLNSSEAYKAADGSIVSEDTRPATSFLLRDEQRRLPFERVSSSCVRSTSGSRDGTRKRTCRDKVWSRAGVTTSPYCI